MTEQRREFISWFVTLLVLVTLSVTLWLLPHPELPSGKQDPHVGAVTITEQHTIHISPGTPFAKRLQEAQAVARHTQRALVEVTGSVLAAVPATAKPATASWEFATPALITTYSEWLQSDADVAFYGKQLGNTRNLSAKRLETQSAVVDRLARLVEVGSDSPRDLAHERASLMEGKLEADRQAHEAEANLNASIRKQAALVLQLEQDGLEPDLLRDAVPGRVLLVAEVPETRMGGLKEGLHCVVHLYASPEPLHGHVERVLPTLSTLQRTLRLVVLLDGPPSDAARPGMFADVGIGTDVRSAVMVPQNAIVHVGSGDYVLTAAGRDEWRVRRVALGPSEGDLVEVVHDLAPGERLIADGVVLLKPVMAELVHAESSTP